MEFAKGASIAEQERVDKATEETNLSHAQHMLRRSQKAQMLARNDQEVYEAEQIRKSDAAKNRSNEFVLQSKKEMDELLKRKKASERDLYLDQDEQFRRQRSREVRFENAHDKAEKDARVRSLEHRAQKEVLDMRQLRENVDHAMCAQINEKLQLGEEKRKQKILDLEERQG